MDQMWMKKKNSSSNHTASEDGVSSKRRPSCNPSPGQDYEVFLSFSGQDTRKGFTDHLYYRLDDAGVRVFRDNEGLQVGEKIGPELMKAIETSKISIIIISLNYASSEWCLRELVHILECKKTGQVVIPIFYKVTPSDIRNQKGEFGKAFLSHQMKCGSNDIQECDIQEWRNALKEVADLKGFESEKFEGGHEGKLVKKILRKVLKKLKKVNLVVDKHLIGVQDHIEKIIKMVDPKASDVVEVILIHGMGGIGKTTLAKLIYNHFSTQYDHCSFLPNVRERSSDDRGKVDLQKLLISNILGHESAGDIEYVDAGINIIKKRLRDKKVLILLDDVDHRDQLNALAQESEWFKPGSLLIVTSRNKDIMDKWHKKLTYRLDELDPEQSFRLFCLHAFRGDSARQSEIENIARAIVSTTGGLPLAIEVIGSLLSAQPKNSWEDTLQMLKETPNDEVMGKLRISYDSLQYEERQIFLDVACCSIIARNKDDAYYMWDACNFHPRLRVKKLISLSLIKIGDTGELIMHDQLKDLGKEIVRQESVNDLGKRSRVWNNEDAVEVLNEQQEPKKEVELLHLDFLLSGKRVLHRLTSEHFKGFQKLRFLNLQHSISLNGDFNDLLPNLRWLRLFSMKTMPINFHPRKLVVLHLGDIPITKDWNGWSQIEVVNKLCIEWCESLETIGDLSHLKKLRELSLWDCEMLSGVEGIGQVTSLEALDIRSCKSLETVGDLSHLKKLRQLNLRACEMLSGVEGIGQLTSLEELCIQWCESLETIGDLSHLKKLRQLNLRDCEMLSGVEGIGQVTSLEDLHIQRYKSLETIGDLSHLKKLRQLNLQDCEMLSGVEGIGQVTSLEALHIRRCKSLETIGDLSHLKKLRNLRLEYCEMLSGVEGIGQLTSLEELCIQWCKSLETIGDLSHLKKLRKLTLLDCKMLSGVEGIGQVTSLEALHIERCKSLETIGDLSHLKKLRQLNLLDCEMLSGVEGINQLKSLSRFSVWGCPRMESINK